MDFKRVDLQQFLFDVRAHFRASLEPSEYENASNLFHMTAAAETEKLLERCELLLRQYASTQYTMMNGCQDRVDSNTKPENANSESHKISSERTDYLEMTTTTKSNSPSTSKEEMDLRSSTDSDKTFRSSTRAPTNCKIQSKMIPQRDMPSDEEELQIYDICQVSQVDADADETQRVITPDLCLTYSADCPYMDLPAGHLAIQRSTKYGQLQRIEKRLFFDQSKKCYCGILNDWLLCYADGPTSAHPSTTLHLKSPGIEIEHSGEGKRREICFQITTVDPSKKLVFQAINEVDAKEWIHAIEAAIRGDTSTAMKNGRKLPTPPVVKKLTFLEGCHREKASIEQSIINDYIYEEPSPIYNCNEPTELLINTLQNPPRLPAKNSSPTALAKKFEYDIPKHPPQPTLPSTEAVTTSEGVPTDLLNESEINTLTTQTPTSCSDEALQVDFQTKVKDMHSKLSSQLSAGPTSVRLKKAIKKTYSGSSNDSEVVSLTNSPASASKEQKKQKKSNSPNISPQKPPSGKEGEKSAKNWFLNRLNKTTAGSIQRCGNGNNAVNNTNTKCKHSEKENLLSSLEMGDNCDGSGELVFKSNSISSSPTSCIRSDGRNKVITMVDTIFSQKT